MSQKHAIDLFITKLLFYRKLRGFSQSDLSEKALISVRNYQRIESGESTPRIETLYNIAKALDVNIEYFVCNLDFQESIKSSLRIFSCEDLELVRFLEKQKLDYEKDLTLISKDFRSSEVLENFPMQNKDSLLLTLDGVKLPSTAICQNESKNSISNYNLLKFSEIAASLLAIKDREPLKIRTMVYKSFVDGDVELMYSFYTYLDTGLRYPIIYAHNFPITEFKASIKSCISDKIINLDIKTNTI